MSAQVLVIEPGHKAVQVSMTSGQVRVRQGVEAGIVQLQPRMVVLALEGTLIIHMHRKAVQPAILPAKDHGTTSGPLQHLMSLLETTGAHGRRGLQRTGGKYGMVTMCIGTGMGAAGIIEAL